MAKLIYSTLASLDGYIADDEGNFDWAAPDDDVHAFLNDRMRNARTFLLGRRSFEVLEAWEDTTIEGDDPESVFAGIWHAADKIVYSRKLPSVSTLKTRLIREFDPDATRDLKSSTQHDMIIGGPTLAAHALHSGLVDELHLYVIPCIIGDGLAWLPPGLRLNLSLQDEHRFAGGTVYLNYRLNAG
jgi:dihydrofolate reductase